MSKEEYERRIEERKMEYNYNKLSKMARNATIANAIHKIIIIGAVIFCLFAFFESVQMVYDTLVVQKQENEEYEKYQQHQKEIERQEEQQLMIDNRNKKDEIRRKIHETVLTSSDYMAMMELEFKGGETVELMPLTLLINNDRMPLNEELLCEDLIQLYKNLAPILDECEYDYFSIYFVFTDGNPFAIKYPEAYKDGGYIKRNDGDYHVHIDG